jgi:hypothetical protein
MWVIIKETNRTEIKYFKRKFIRYYTEILMNKIKKKEIEVIDDEKTFRRFTR